MTEVPASDVTGSFWLVGLISGLGLLSFALQPTNRKAISKAKKIVPILLFTVVVSLSFEAVISHIRIPLQ